MARKSTEDAISEYDRLKQCMKNGNLHNLYVFYGEEAYLRDYYYEAVRKKVLSGPASAFNEHIFSSGDVTPEGLSNALEAMPVMAEKSFIRIDDTDLFKYADDAKNQFAEILSDVPEYCVVVLTYESDEFKIPAGGKKLAEVLKKNARIVEFKKRGEHELMNWCFRHFASENKQISDDDCRLLIFKTDGDMTLLGSEISKLCAYCSGTTISKSDIEAVVIPVLTAQTFDISNAIAGGDYEKALQILQDLVAMRIQPVVIFGAISTQIRRLHYAKMISSAGRGQDILSELCQIKPYPAGLAMTASRKVSEQFCSRAMDICMETDRAMKSSVGEAGMVMQLELLITRLSMEARNG